MSNIFSGFDFDSFWEFLPDLDDGSFDSYRERTIRIGKPINEEQVQAVQEVFGHPLPKSYIDFLRYRNGGRLRKNILITKNFHSYPYNYLYVERLWNIDVDNYYYSIYGLAYKQRFYNDVQDIPYRDKAPKNVSKIKKLLSEKPSVFPDIGIYFSPIYDMPTTLNWFQDFLAFDYRACDKNGEPQIVHVQLQNDGINDKINIYFVAKNFETLIKDLQTREILNTIDCKFGLDLCK